MISVLVADDNIDLQQGIKRSLNRMGLEVFTASNGLEAIEVIQKQTRVNPPGVNPPCAIAILDIRMPGQDGIEVLKKIREISPKTRTVLMTAHSSLDTAIEALRNNASDYILKPFSMDEIQSLVRRLMERYELNQHKVVYPQSLEDKESRFVGQAPSIQKIRKLIRQIAITSSPVLILGESGTGKELVAHEIHRLSPRKEQPFVAINCSALPPGILESELFGHEKGSFTGALAQKEGLIETAKGGTLLLDEIGDLPTSLQVKLLRFLQEHEIQRVGGVKAFKVDVRILAATNKNLEKVVEKGEFRQDLLYRLNVFEITLPPLRERLEDIPFLIDHFIEKYQKKLHKETSLSPEAKKMLNHYPWPGNIRELENVIERAVALAANKIPITCDEFPDRIIKHVKSFPLSFSEQTESEISKSGNILNNMEKETILKILEKNRWNQTKAAQQLGIKRTTLRYRIEKYGLISKNVEGHL